MGVPSVLAWAVKTQPVRDEARRIAVQVIHDELGLDAHIGDVQVELLPPALLASDVMLDDAVYGRFASVRSARVEPSLVSLFSGEPELSSVEVDGATVRLVVREGEVRNLPRPRAQASGGSSRIPLRDLAVSDAQIEIDAAPFAQAHLRHVDVDVAVTGGTILDVRVASHDGEVEHPLGSEALRRIDARARITPTEVRVHVASLDTPTVQAEVRNVRLELPRPERIAGHVDLHTQLERLHTLPLGVTFPDIEGSVHVAGDVAWSRADGVSGHGTVDTHHARITQFQIGDVHLVVDGDEHEVHVRDGSTVQIMREGGELGLTATLGLGPGLPVSANVAIRGLQFEKLMEQLGVSKRSIVEWLLEGDIALEGTLEPLALGGRIRTQTRDFMVTQGPYFDLPRSRVIGAPRANIAGDVRVDPDGLHLERLVGEFPRSRLYADVLLGFDSKKLHVDARAELDVADIQPLLDFGLTGQGTAHVIVDGTYDHQEVYGSTALRGFSFDGHPFGDVSSEFRLEKNAKAVRFPWLASVFRDSRFALQDFVLDFSDQRFELSGTLVAERLTLLDLYHVVHYEEDERFLGYQATLVGRAPLRFTMGFPGDLPTGTLDLDVELTVPTASINDYAFHDGELSGHWLWRDWPRGFEGGELTIRDAMFRKGDGTLVAQGRMTEGGHLDLTAALDQLALSEVEGIGDRFPQLIGVIGATARVRGTASVPLVHLDTAVTGMSWKGRPLGDARFYVRLTEQNDPWVAAARTWSRASPPEGEPCGHARAGFAHGRWAPDPPVHTRDGPVPALDRPMAFLVCGEGLDGHLRVDLAIGRTKVFPLRGLLAIDDLDLAAFLPVSRGANVHGHLTGETLLTGGSMREEDSLVGRIRVSDLRVGQENVELRNDGPVDIRLSRGDFQFVRARFAGPSSLLALSGGGSMTRGLATTIDGEIDLALLASLSPSVVEAGGRVGLEVRVSGPFQNPALFGTAIVTGGAFRLAAYDEPIENLDARLTFSERTVLLESLHAEVAGGALDAQGEATLEGRGLRAYDFHIGARDISLRPYDGVDVAFGADTRLSWQDGERLPTLRGDLHVSRLFYSRAVALGATLTELTRQSREEVDEFDPDSERVQFDLRVVQDAPMRVQNNLVDARLQILDSERPFRIVGTNERYGVLGSLGIDQGVVRFRNTEFEIRRGTLDFDEETRIDPSFDVRALATIRRGGDTTVPAWRVNLHAYGTRSEFRLDTTSEPDLPQEDIVLLLTIGMTRAEAEQLRNGSLPTSAALEALATVTGLDREVRNAVPVIDDFRIGSSYSVRTNRTEPNVSIGKRLADRVRLTATTGLGEAREIRAYLEWRLDDETSIQASYDNLDNTGGASAFGNAGADVRWHIEFE